uniref:Uncharacterized protein n=1 Tax=Onchocerca volvulus TaxID=6282 RepID=A0A8R1XVH1_ONCVO
MDDDDDDDDDETMTTPSKQNISHFLPSQLAANRSSSLTMNLSATILDNVIPTAAREEALVVDPDVASTSTQMMPKKGILKRSSSHGNFPRKNAIERNLAGQFFESKQSPERFSDRPNTKIPKLTLTWSEKNAVNFMTFNHLFITVTIYGDTTSDDGNTETDDINVPVIGSVSNGQHLPSQRSVVRLNELPKIATKIPFTVHRVQNNSKLERQTSILDNDDENEDEEVLHDDDDELAEFDNNNHAKLESNAAIGNSHIAGKWWFGKSTKNIPHCAKWGCTHDHRDKESTDNGGKYLTPTQQRFKEIHQLRKQLKLALSQLEDKDLHLNELREQLRDLESVVGSANIISEKHQHLLHKESNEDYEREKKKLIDKHEIRVRQLIKEAVDARAEMMQVKIAMKQLEEAKVKTEVKDAEMMTEMVEEISPSEIHPEPSRLSSSFSPSSQTGNAAEARIGQIPQELSLQLQAYENEAMAWRMKAAQLEMVLKDYISKKQQDIFNPELEKYRNDNERLRTYIKNIEANMSNHAMIDSGFQTCLNVLLETSADCCSQQCEERRKQLREENNHLLEKIEEQTLRLNEHDENIKLLRQTIHSMNEENKKSLHTMKQMSKEIEERTAEVEVANITALQLQSELGIKTKAICYLEERHQVYRNTILDHDLVVKDESTDDWERGFSDPRYVVNVSKRVQTDLTVEILRENELKFIEITEKLEALIKEFSAKENKMLEHFREIEKDLSAKNSLVGSLANQLEKADQEAKKSSELQQKEREAFQKKLYELGQVAENIPVLQFEIEKLQQERSLMENRLKNIKEEYEAGLDMALAESLKKYRKQSDYWTAKMSATNASSELLRNENIALKRSIEELKLRTQLQQADLSKRLTSSINHISYLKKQASLNRSTRDVQVDVHPRVVSKYVACRPNARHKMTDIEKGDLFDEVEERLKLYQGELNTSRQEVAVLQQKLVDNVQIQVEDHSLRKKFSPVNVLPMNKELRSSMITNSDTESKLKIDDLLEQIEELEKQNHNLTVRLLGFETEKQNLLDNQREQVSHNILEFDIFRKELNQELGRFENERQKLKARIALLAEVKEERDKLFELLENKIMLGKSYDNDSNAVLQTSPFSVQTQGNLIAFTGNRKKIKMDQKFHRKRWMSAPHLFRLSTAEANAVSSNEATILRERNFILVQENARLNEELISLKHFIKSSMHSTSYTPSNNDNILPIVNEHSPSFNFTADLMQVQEDLENVIEQIDNSANTNKIEDYNRRSKSPSLSPRERNSSSSNIAKLEDLRIALKKSYEEQKALADQLDQVTLNFQDACRELDLYKHELREDALKYSYNIRLPRSRSFTEIGRATVNLDEYLRWKEKAGTMFRELNRIRKEYHASDDERRELRMQLVMLRGELGLAQSQLAEMLSKQQRKPDESVLNVSAISEDDTSSSMLIKRKKMKSKLLRDKHSDEFCDAMDSSSSIFFTASSSFYSLDDAFYSISEPDLVATKFEGAREYRFSSHGYHDYYLLSAHFQESHGPSTYLERIQLNPKEHEEVIKEAAKLKIRSLSEKARQKKDINEKDLWNSQSESLLSSCEKQNIKNKQRLRLEKHITEEQKKLTKESAGQSQKKKMLTKENNEMVKGRQKIYPTTLKKNEEEEISRRK